MSEKSTAEQAMSQALTDDELHQIVGGDSDPNDPVGTATGPVDVDMKATPILM